MTDLSDLDRLHGAALDQRLRSALREAQERLHRAGVPNPVDVLERHIVRTLALTLNGIDLLAGQAAPEVRQ